MNFKQGDPILVNGERKIFRSLGGGVYSIAYSDPGVAHSQRFARPEDVQPAEPKDHSQGYDFTEHLFPRMQGWVPWEHVEEITDAQARERTIGSLALAGWTVPPSPGSLNREWARYFLHTGQFTGLTGEGLAIVWRSGGYRLFRVAICEHEKAPGRETNERRGYYPGKCRLCGFDMMVDSGD